MLGPYAAILRTPGARPLVAASLAGRLPFGLIDLAIVVLVERQTGSFALAGLALGANAAGLAASSPLRGRLLDQLGARRLLPPMALAFAAAMVAIILFARADLRAALVIASLVGGVVSPPLVPAMRLEWQRLLGVGTPELERAYAFETSAQITVFVAGPLLTAAGVALGGPELPLAIAAALMLAGGPLFAVRAGAIPDLARERTRGFGSMVSGGVRTLVLVTLLADAALGILDIAVIATATDRGHAAASGVLLAGFAAGSVIGATLYGTRTWNQPAGQRLGVVLAVFAAALTALALVEPLSLVVLAVLLVVAGAPSAAQWTTISVALDDVTPPGQAAEAFTWLSSANAAGIALGGVAAGLIVDAAGARSAMFLAATVVLLAMLALATQRGSLVRPAEALELG